MIRHATLPSRPRTRRRLPAVGGSLAVAGSSSITFSTSSISFPSSFLRTLPFSVHFFFHLNFLLFNGLRTLLQKQGGVYQLFPKWNILVSAGNELWLSVPRITNHQLALFSSIPFPFFILRTLLRNGRSTTPFDSSASALFLSQRRCRGVVLVCLTKSFSACPLQEGLPTLANLPPATRHLPPATRHL